MTESGRVMLVDNGSDTFAVARHLGNLGPPGSDDGHRRIVVRPTPGADDRLTLALDVLAAAGKNPEVVRAEKPGPAAWELAAAWLTAARTDDLVVDRAHDLSTDQVTDLAALGAGIGATVWLVWSGSSSWTAAAQKLTDLGHRVTPVGWTTAARQLPVFPRQFPAPQRREDGPALPGSDFPTFLADCRRLLSPRVFEQVATQFHAAAERAEDWLDSDRGAQPLSRMLLVGWLRDEQLGPVTSAPAALIVLRATQAALFLRGSLLSWNPATLGPDPADRLPGTLTTLHGQALAAMSRTDHAAATALILHLNVGPTVFSCWRIGNVADNGSHINLPDIHHHQMPSGFFSTQGLYGQVRDSTTATSEIPCATPVRLPVAAWPLLAAHCAYRRGQGAGDQDALFIHPTERGRVPDSILREAVIRTCDRINVSPPWMHRNDCHYGTDVGLNPRRHGWCVERGLTLHSLDDGITAHLPRRPRLGKP